MADDAPRHPDEPDWDHVTDVLCAGSNAGVRAFAALCADRGLEVMTVALPSGPLDADSAEFIAAMTDGLAQSTPEGDDREPIRARPEEFRRGRGERIDTFIGAQLRPWASKCLASPTGVLFTYVPDHALRPMRTDGGDLITAAVVPQHGDQGAGSDETLTGLVLIAGRPAGAVLDGPDGRRLVAAELGLAFDVGHADGERLTAADPAALVSRRGSLFARLQPLICDD